MKRTVYISCMIFVVLSFCGCTHNNGDIGPWFGQWKVERIDKDGMPDPDYCRVVVFKIRQLGGDWRLYAF